MSRRRILPAFSGGGHSMPDEFYPVMRDLAEMGATGTGGVVFTRVGGQVIFRQMRAPNDNLYLVLQKGGHRTEYTVYHDDIDSLARMLTDTWGFNELPPREDDTEEPEPEPEEPHFDRDRIAEFASFGEDTDRLVMRTLCAVAARGSGRLPAEIAHQPVEDWIRDQIPGRSPAAVTTAFTRLVDSDRLHRDPSGWTVTIPTDLDGDLALPPGDWPDLTDLLDHHPPTPPQQRTPDTLLMASSDWVDDMETRYRDQGLPKFLRMRTRIALEDLAQEWLDQELAVTVDASDTTPAVPEAPTLDGLAAALDVVAAADATLSQARADLAAADGRNFGASLRTAGLNATVQVLTDEFTRSDQAATVVTQLKALVAPATTDHGDPA